MFSESLLKMNDKREGCLHKRCANSLLISFFDIFLLDLSTKSFISMNMSDSVGPSGDDIGIGATKAQSSCCDSSSEFD